MERAHVPLASDEPGIGLEVERGFNDTGKSEVRAGGQRSEARGTEGIAD
jgi:hypothetical protein